MEKLFFVVLMGFVMIIGCSDVGGQGVPEVCDDGRDNDLDGLVDCKDPDCLGTLACPDPLVQVRCGDGRLNQAWEECEGNYFAGQSCLDYGFNSGNLICNNCRIFTDNCSYVQGPFCGDGLCNNGENASTCPADCYDPNPICGNGIAEGTEECDGLDSNREIDCVYWQATCVSCRWICSCGDGVCQSAYGENANTCSRDCGTNPYCGDNLCNNGETSSTCSQDCGPSIYCGDGLCNGNENYQTCLVDCPAPSGEICGDLLDNDRDGLIDYLDDQCPGSAEKFCSNNADDDGDGYSNCVDHDCVASDQCRSSFASGDEYLAMIPGQGYSAGINGAGCYGSDQYEVSGWFPSCTGAVNTGNFYSSSRSRWGAAWVGSSCSATNINAYGVDMASFQLQCVSPYPGACANTRCYAHCGPGGTQVNITCVMDTTDLEQQADLQAMVFNGQAFELPSNQIVWYRGLTPVY